MEGLGPFTNFCFSLLHTFYESFYYLQITWVVPLPSNSGKWRFIGISESPTKHEIILVVTITGKGDNPTYHHVWKSLYDKHLTLVLARPGHSRVMVGTLEDECMKSMKWMKWAIQPSMMDEMIICFASCLSSVYMIFHHIFHHTWYSIIFSIIFSGHFSSIYTHFYTYLYNANPSLYFPQKKTIGILHLSPWKLTWHAGKFPAFSS